MFLGFKVLARQLRRDSTDLSGRVGEEGYILTSAFFFCLFLGFLASSIPPSIPPPSTPLPYSTSPPLSHPLYHSPIVGEYPNNGAGGQTADVGRGGFVTAEKCCTGICTGKKIGKAKCDITGAAGTGAYGGRAGADRTGSTALARSGAGGGAVQTGRGLAPFPAELPEVELVGVDTALKVSEPREAGQDTDRARTISENNKLLPPSSQIPHVLMAYYNTSR